MMFGGLFDLAEKCFGRYAPGSRFSTSLPSCSNEIRLERALECGSVGIRAPLTKGLDRFFLSGGNTGRFLEIFLLLDKAPGDLVRNWLGSGRSEQHRGAGGFAVKP